jgi:hypothetical protein
MASTYTPIATYTLGSAAASYTFTSIPQTYTDLIVVISGTNDTGDSEIAVQVGNGSVNTGTVYSTTFLYGNGTSAGSSRDSTQSYAHVARLSNNMGNSVIHFMNYANTTTYKTILGRGGAAGNLTMATVSLVRDTVNYNTIKLAAHDGGSWNFTTGTTFTLYGIQAA